MTSGAPTNTSNPEQSAAGAPPRDPVAHLATFTEASGPRWSHPEPAESAEGTVHGVGGDKPHFRSVLWRLPIYTGTEPRGDPIEKNRPPKKARRHALAQRRAATNDQTLSLLRRRRQRTVRQLIFLRLSRRHDD